MIAFANRLPHVLWVNQRLVPLSEGWLTEAIEESAREVGHQHWELAPHVARAISEYLEADCTATVLSVETLESMLKRSLHGIGYEEIALHSRITPPRVSIYLPELAHQQKMELAFYPELNSRLEQAMAFEVKAVRLVGLRDCAKILDAARKWRKTCESIRDNIIAFSEACLKRSKTKRCSVELVLADA
ncbi:MAG: hypothetical protein AAGK14_07265 [Verrucomicrobiota bacterium]